MHTRQLPPPDDNGGRWSVTPCHKLRTTARPKEPRPTAASPWGSIALPVGAPLPHSHEGRGCDLYQGEAAAVLLRTWDLVWAAVGFDQAARDDLRDRLARLWCRMEGGGS